MNVCWETSVEKRVQFFWNPITSKVRPLTFWIALGSRSDSWASAVFHGYYKPGVWFLFDTVSDASKIIWETWLPVKYTTKNTRSERFFRNYLYVIKHIIDADLSKTWSRTMSKCYIVSSKQPHLVRYPLCFARLLSAKRPRTVIEIGHCQKKLKSAITLNIDRWLPKVQSDISPAAWRTTI